MHIPDGFLSTPVWAGLQAISIPSAVVAARYAQSQVSEHRVPLMGVMGAFVFAAQMINFPVGAGASGHLMGAALLTATLGPAAASVVLTAVLVIQALLFQDGGLLALGANLFNMAIAGVLVAWIPWRFLGQRNPSLAAGLAGFLSVFVAACLAMTELAASGITLPSGVLALSMGVFSVTALLEGLLTVAVLRALEKLNPGWVRKPAGMGRPVLAAFLVGALVLVTVGVLIASSLPDGLETLAGAVGISGRESALFAAPLADYELMSAENPWLRKAGAGLIGLTATWLFCLAAGRWIARLRNA